MNERALVATLLATACAAAVQAADPPEEDAGLDEIVVTAGRRAESLQDVAASVTAFTPESLSRSGINTTVDLQLRTPGLLVSTNGSFGQPYLRGIGSDVINPGADAPVAVFIDGAYQPRPTSAITDFFDVERVEVLKGPQGTLYGRNATGGAIRLVTRDPGEELAAEADALFGNYERRRVRAAANLPLGEAAAVRVAGYYAERDGFTRNLFTGRRLDDEDLWGVRAKLRIASTERFSLVAGAERVREDSTRNNAAKVVDSPALPLPVRDLAPLLGYAPPATPADPFDVRFDFQPRTFLEQTRANATAEWKLAAVTLTSITGYTRARNIGDFDLDATEIDFSYDREADRSRSYTQTLQLSSADTARLSWIAGLEYLNERASQNFDARLPLFGPPSPIRLGPASPVAGFVWDSSLRTRAASAFLDGGYEMTPRLTVSAGVRYSREKKEADFTQTLIDPFGILTGGASLPFGGRIVIPAQPQRTFEAWTPRVRIEFRPADDLLLYAAATRGFKSGGFNLMNTAEIFEPEKIWSYEVGVKGTWLDDRLRTNASAFYYDYEDLQVNQFSGVTNLITNAATSKIAGVEAEILARPAGALELDFSAAYLDATYREYLTRDANLPGAPVVDLSGNRMPKAPELTLTAGAELSTAVTSAGAHLVLRGEVRYQSSAFFDQFETPQLEQGGYSIVNARLAFAGADDSWSVAAFGRNLGDKLYRQGMVRVDNVFGTVAFLGAPRTYGFEVTARL